jgi:hypothetical protein
MVKRFVAGRPLKQELCAGSELSTHALRNALLPTLSPTNVGRVEHHCSEISNVVLFQDYDTNSI